MRNLPQASLPPASLPMYDFPELQEATDRWWQALRAAFARRGWEALPEELLRGKAGFDAWYEEDLFLSQACGYDLVFRLVDKVKIIGTPVYAVPGCSGANYSSAIMLGPKVQATSFRELQGLRLAINSAFSHSGMSSIRYMTAKLLEAEPGLFPFWGEVVASGGHRASLGLLQGGRVDVAAIDAVSFALLSEAEPSLVAGLRRLDYTPLVAGLPYITAKSRSEEEIKALQEAVLEVVHDPALAPVRERLKIADFALLGMQDYASIVDFAKVGFAAKLGGAFEQDPNVRD